VASPTPAPLALICSVALEAEPVQLALSGAQPLIVGRRPALAGRIGVQPVIVLAGGMGKTNVAQALTALAETQALSGVVGFGVGGAYPGSGLHPGEVALATAQVYGDEGVAAPGGWLDTEGIGIPLCDRPGLRRFNEFPIDPARLAAAVAALRAVDIEPVAGTFVTVSCCSGTAARGEELALRFDAVCETMEGAACAHVAALYDLPYLEVRGISNLVEDRELSRWRLHDGAHAAAEAVIALARGWSHISDTSPVGEGPAGLKGINQG
jgi:futalosine hydrolase